MLPKILRFPLKLAALILHWRETGRRIKRVFAANGSSSCARSTLPPSPDICGAHSVFSRPPSIVSSPARGSLCTPAEGSACDRECLGRRLNAAYRRSSQPSWAPLRNEVVTSALPAHGSHKGMSIDVVPKPNSRHLVRCIFSRFRPHIVHVHYWGDVDEHWYKMIFRDRG